MSNELILNLFLAIPGLLLAFTVHELAHAAVANWLGDPTAKDQGRITFNPLPHLDPIGTAVLLFSMVMGGMAFGWARPVQYDPRNLRNPRRDGALIAAAGPMANLMTGCLLAATIRFGLVTLQNDSTVFELVYVATVINFGLFLFNMIPLPPLDGSKVLLGFLPDSLADTLEEMEARYGAFIPFLLLLLIFSPVLREPLSFAMNALLSAAFGVNLLYR